MKRYIQFLTIALAAGALFASCDKSESEADVAGGKAIRFSATVGHYQVKATDTAFEEGDAIGLFAADPVAVENVRLSWTGNELTPDAPVYWGEYQPTDKAVAFYAYYPYAEQTATQFSFAVPEDQSTEEAFKAADLMISSTTASPKDDAVVLHFAHRMSRVIFQIDNRVDGEIVDVSVDGIALDAQVDVTVPSVTLAENAAPGTVKAAHVADTDGNDAWAIILPAQSCEPVVNIAMDNGKVYTVKPEEGITLMEGRNYNVGIIIDDAMAQLEFSADVTDWIDDWGWIGKDDDPGKLPVTWYISVDGAWNEMTELEDGRWYVLVPYVYGYHAEIQVVKSNNYSNDVIPWNQYFGVNVPDDHIFTVNNDEPLDLALTPDSVIRIASEAEVLEFWLDPQARRLTIGNSDYQWQSIGTGSIVETAIAASYGLPKQEMEVEFFQDPRMPDIYRIVEPYKNWVCPEGFRYTKGEDLILYVDENRYVHFNDTYTGVRNDRAGSIVITSWNGYLMEQEGYIYFWSLDVVQDGNLDTIEGSTRNYMYVVLPGGSRPLDNEVSLSFDGLVDGSSPEGEVSSTKVARIGLYTGMDIQDVRGGLAVAKLSATEIRAFASMLIQESESIEFENQCWVELEIPITQTGVYTYVAVAQNTAGQWVYGSTNFSALLEDEAPEAVMDVTAAPGIFAEQSVRAHVTFENPGELYALIIEKDAWTESGLTDDDIYDYVMSNGTMQYSAYMGTDGQDITFQKLTPKTDYLVFVAGISAFDMSAWAQCEVSTGTAPEFTSFGTGHYHDNWVNAFGWEGWHTEIEIMKADTDPVRYRAMAPYKAYWEKHSNVEYYYGESADYIDFCIVGNEFHYLPYLNGYLEPGIGAVQYNCYNSYSGIFYPYNTKLAEGVYNIAPAAYILGTGYWYNMTQDVGTIYLEMPGYTLPDDEEEGQAEPAGAPAKVKEQGQVMAPHTKVLPFTRHMLHTGAVKVSVREQ